MNKFRRVSASIFALAGLALLILATGIVPGTLSPDSAQGAYPGQNGRIAFSSNSDGDLEIYTMNPDGTDVVQLTHNDAFDGEGNYSADGSKIAFSSDRSGAFDIWTMDAAGGNQTNLTDDAALDFSPDWSPDGTKIAFSSDRDGDYEIYVMDANGDNVTQLTFDDATDYLPKWSPDGTKIAFETNRDGNGEIYVMDADGSNPVNLTDHPASDQDPDWSPDGSQIVFMSYREDIGAAGGPVDEDIFRMDADGDNVVQLTDFARNERHPRWSPDGTMIVYSGHASGEPGFEVVVMKADDGSGKVNLTETGDTESASDWQPLQAETATPTATVTPTPTSTSPPALALIQGDVNCSGEVDPVDSLGILRADAGLSVAKADPDCPDIGDGLQVAGAPGGVQSQSRFGLTWGDVDCDGSSSPVDALKVLRHDAGLSVSQEEDCPDIGDTVQATLT